MTETTKNNETKLMNAIMANRCPLTPEEMAIDSGLTHQEVMHQLRISGSGTFREVEPGVYDIAEDAVKRAIARAD